jgi:hypothetical protein
MENVISVEHYKLYIIIIKLYVRNNNLK